MITAMSSRNCCRWRPRFNYPQKPQNTGIDLHGANDGRVRNMKKTQKVLLFMEGLEGGGGFYNVVGSGN